MHDGLAREDLLHLLRQVSVRLRRGEHLRLHAGRRRGGPEARRGVTIAAAGGPQEGKSKRRLCLARSCLTTEGEEPHLVALRIPPARALLDHQDDVDVGLHRCDDLLDAPGTVEDVVGEDEDEVAGILDDRAQVGQLLPMDVQCTPPRSAS